MVSFIELDDKSLQSIGILKSSHEEDYRLRVLTIGGRMNCATLKAIAQAAELYGRGYVYFTTRQGVEIPHIHLEDMENAINLLRDSGVDLGLTGENVRGITACPGEHCPHGLIDCQELAHTLFSAIQGLDGLPGKLKIGVTGCASGCIKPIENDLSVMGEENGLYAMYVGGKSGGEDHAERLPVAFPDPESLIAAIQAAIDWYAKNAQSSESFGAAIDRIGLESLKEHILSTATIH